MAIKHDILWQLKRNERMYVTQIAIALRCSVAHISTSCKELFEADILKKERVAQQVFYTLTISDGGVAVGEAHKTLRE